jgi:hypothetical protein
MLNIKNLNIFSKIMLIVGVFAVGGLGISAYGWIEMSNKLGFIDQLKRASELEKIISDIDYTLVDSAQTANEFMLTANVANRLDLIKDLAKKKRKLRSCRAVITSSCLKKVVKFEQRPIR